MRDEPMDEHESIRKMLPLAVAGALELEDRGRLERHARSCEDCRREMEVWSRYAQALQRLPQPSVPAGLLDRTQSRILQQNQAADAHRVNAIMLGATALLGWGIGPVMWLLVRAITGGVVDMHGFDRVSLLSWSLLLTVLTWITAAASAMALVRRREMERGL